MTKGTITKKITGAQIERLHHFLDVGFSSLTEDDAQLLDRVVESYTEAAHRNKAIVLQQTDRIDVGGTLIYGDFSHNITTKKRTLKCVV